MKFKLLVIHSISLLSKTKLRVTNLTRLGATSWLYVKVSTVGEETDKQVLNGGDSDYGAKSLDSAQSLSAKEETRVCIISMESLKNVVLLPCKHMCRCEEPHENCELTECTMCCSLCRGEIKEGIVAYV